MDQFEDVDIMLSFCVEINRERFPSSTEYGWEGNKMVVEENGLRKVLVGGYLPLSNLGRQRRHHVLLKY